MLLKILMRRPIQLMSAFDLVTELFKFLIKDKSHENHRIIKFYSVC